MIDGFLRKHYFLPSEHGAWIWLAGPFVLGSAAGGGFSGDLLLLGLAGLTAFLLRQPITIAVKVASGRRPRRQLAPALFWAGIYLFLLLAWLSLLWWRGHGQILLLAIPGVPVFLGHLWLVRRRQERDRPGVEIVAAGVLALIAPAAYWVAGGRSDLTAWLVWGLAWFHSASSIVGVHLRLQYRRMGQAPGLRTRLRMGSRSLAYHGFNLAAAGLLVGWIKLPVWVAVGFGLALADAVEAALRPAIEVPPAAIGLRQLLVSATFYAVVSLAMVGWQPAG